MIEDHSQPASTNLSHTKYTFAWLLVCIIVTAVCMSPTLSNGWLNWDDGAYVLQNTLIHELSLNRVYYMFSTPEVVGSYHPLTLLSLSIDYAIAGKDPFPYHITNLLLHLLNVAMVFYFAQMLFRNRVVAVITAILFGIHPMHVEPVAWISARKDLLYAFFQMTSLVAYLHFLNKRSNRRWGFYFASFGLFVCSMLSKGLAMTLPVLLLLIDYSFDRKFTFKQVLEKIPFFAISVSLGIVGIAAQQVGGAMGGLTDYLFHKTIFVGSYNTLIYFVKAFVPYHLSAFHPFPFQNAADMPWYFYASILPFLALIFFVLRSTKQTKKLIFGFGFFLITIAPTLQVLPYGRAIIAERYTYVPYIGLFFLCGIGFVWAKQRFRNTSWAKIIVPLVASSYLVLLAGMTFNRCAVWKNGETLWANVVNKYPDDHFGYLNLAGYWKQQGEVEAALSNFNLSIELNPKGSDAYFERGRIYEQKSQPELALQDYIKVIELNPTDPRAYLNRSAVVYRSFKNSDLALKDLDAAISLKSDYAPAYINKGVIFEQAGDLEAAFQVYSEGIYAAPKDARLHRYRGVINLARPDLNSAIADLSQAIDINPVYAEAYFLRSKAYLGLGDYTAALEDAKRAKGLSYEVSEAYIDDIKKSIENLKQTHIGPY